MTNRYHEPSFPLWLTHPSFAPWLKGVRETAFRFIVLMILAQCLLSTFMNLVVGPTGFLQSIHIATDGWINATFLAYLPVYLVLGFLAWKIGRLRWNDFGMSWSKLAWGVLWTLIAWGITQLTPFFLSDIEKVIRPEWYGHAPAYLCDFIEGQIIANAMQEELFFRVFLISQVTLLLRRTFKCNWTLALIGSVLVAGVIFSICHIPNRIAGNDYGSITEALSNQVHLLLMAIYFTMLFLLTNNIFIAVGIHALVNSSPDILTGTDFGFAAVLILLIFIIRAVWRWWTRADFMGAPKDLG